MSKIIRLPRRVEEWTKDEVYYWLTEVINIDKNYAEKLYNADVAGDELLCYQRDDLLHLGIKHGPAVKIITRLKEIKQHYEPESEYPEHSQIQQEEDRLNTIEDIQDLSTDQTQISRHTAKKSEEKSNQKINSHKSTTTNVGKKAMDIIKNTQTADSPPTSQEKKCKETLSCSTFRETELRESADPKTLVINADNITVNKKSTRRPEQHSCSLYPFDQSSASHRYIQNYTLPPETGPDNLIDPVHEYKFMGRTDDITVMKKKFNKEVFRFAAGCMNSRTNGTIHFGVADSKDSQYAHAEIIGVSVDKKDTIIDHFNQGIKSHFEEHTDEAKQCIRQPRFVEVLCSDSTLSGKYVIEVDVVPSHSIVHGKLFKIQTLDEGNQWKKSKGNSLFIREGAATRDIYKTGNPKDLHDELTRIKDYINILDKRRKEAENRPERKGTSNQGEKLKNLLPCGGSRLGDDNYYIIVTNKSHPEQLQHLQFMTTLKLFCVLDFDPNSAVNGSCQRYRDVRIANLHTPCQFNKDPGTVATNLNLYKQTSWVFCNGREDLNTESNRPLQPSKWLKHKAGEVQNMISFLCNPYTLPSGRFLVIFLLLSTIEAMNDPIFDTFMSFYKNLGGTENILSICTSNASFQKWRDFIQVRCEHDISQRSICDLELSEINGTILKLGQNKQNAQRLLPSAEGSSVILHKKDEDIMTSLDILCENECENEFDESSAEFEEFKIKTESEFYIGGKVKWWNFYFSEQPAAKPFIKRDKHSKLENSIRSQTRNTKSTCVMLNLFHHPGCGGTTMAMHVMWNLRKEFRCAVLKDNTVSKDEVAKHVAHLIKCGKSENSLKTPVLLLVEDSEETENTQILKRSLMTISGEKGASIIILNCIRTKTPKDRHNKSINHSEFITAELSDKEKRAFEMKLKELQEIKSFITENFYSFMIMKSNFDPKYVTNVATNILKDFRVSESKQTRLFCILALLNSYVAEPAVSRSLCEDFLGIKSALWGIESVLDKMEPYTCLLIESEAEEYGGFKAIRFVHQHLATECVKQLEKTHNCSKADIVLDMLHCDAFFKTFAVKGVLVQSMKSMLITRQRKTDEKDTLFSPLIEDIHSGDDGLNKIQEIFIAASERFDKDFTIPQALARHFYLKEKNFAEAKKWANSAKAIKESSYTVDTVGQVAKSELKHKLECKKQERKQSTTEDLREYLELASTATKAFRQAQILAKTEDTLETEEEPHSRKFSPYNISGYMGEIDTVMIVLDIIKTLPLFENSDLMKEHYIQSFLKGNLPCANIPVSKNKVNNQFIAVLQDYEPFLTSLKSQVKEAFNFLEMYFTYMKEKGSDNMRDAKTCKRISEHYQYYISLFCTSAEDKEKEKKQKPTLSLNMEIEKCRMFLEENRADTFPGLLQILEDRKGIVETIAEKYSFIHEKSPIKTTKDKTNHLLAHIILKLIKPKSKIAKYLDDLNKLLKDLLQDVGTQHQYPEPFYLAILLLWPGRNVNSTTMLTYVDKIRSLAKKHLSRTRSTIAHFFLGTSDGIQRLVPKVSLEKSVRNVRECNILWQTGETFKDRVIKSKLRIVSGTIEQGEVFTEYENHRIPLRPAFLGEVRSGHSSEKVFFYIGFAMDGPLAYNIQYEDER